MPEPQPPQPERPLSGPGLFVRGLCMGTADVIPGVSGGTIALILGIYTRFVDALSSLNVAWVRPLLAAPLRRGPARAEALGRAALHLRAIHWRFLLLLGAGIGSALLLGSRVIPYLLEDHPTETFAFFFGLILASIPIPVRMMPARRWAHLGIALAFAAATFHVVGLEHLRTTDARWFLFVCGAVAICAMVLPGISGSYVLLMLGRYQQVLGAVREVRIAEIAIFGAGMATGLLAFSRVLRHLLHRHRAATLAALVGVMAGALRSVWPFRVETVHVGDKALYRAVLPDRLDGEVLSALVAFAAGAVVLLALERAGARRRG